MAPPTKFTRPRREAILAAIRGGNTRTAAAAAVDVHRETLSIWIEENPSFSDAIQKAEAQAELAHVRVIKSTAEEGNWFASAWWLERRRYRDWGKKEGLELSGPDGAPLVVRFVNDWRSRIEAFEPGQALPEDGAAEGDPPALPAPWTADGADGGSTP
jgi:hypothetical protein